MYPIQIDFFEQDALNVINNRITIRVSYRHPTGYYDYFKKIDRSEIYNWDRLKKKVSYFANGIMKARKMINRLKH